LQVIRGKTVYPASHAGNGGSIPPGITTNKNRDLELILSPCLIIY